MRVFLRTRRSVKRIISVFVFLCLVAAAANAYTLVMLGGRRVEIPSRFVLTPSTLTYEVSPGVQVTFNLAAIDISATEQANHELPGSFRRRALTGFRSSTEEVSGPPVATHTITNRDLEPSTRRRLESELAYERRRKELGLPTVAESRRQAAAESEAIAKELQQTRGAEREAENYWRSRAAALRTEIAALDAQLNYVRRQLDQPLSSTTNGSFATVVSTLPFISFGNFGRTRPLRPLVTERPGVFVAPRSGSQVTVGVVFGGRASRGEVSLNPLAFPRSPRNGPWRAPANVIVYGSTAQQYDLSYSRDILITQFNELAAARAGLSARWRELEDEARRAGAPPGWLRP